MSFLRGRIRNGQMIVDVWMLQPDVRDPGKHVGRRKFRGLIDTGANFSALYEDEISRIGLVSAGQRPVAGADGSTGRVDPVYPVSLVLGFLSSGDGDIDDFRSTRIRMSPMRLKHPDFQLLVGMDVLERYRLCMTNGRFELSAPTLQ